MRYFTLLLLWTSALLAAKAQEAADLTTGKFSQVICDPSSSAWNTRNNAFDGTRGTVFESNRASHGWVGMDLGQKHHITSIRFAPVGNYAEHDRLKLGIFEGANEADFTDALPLHMIRMNEPYESSASGDEWRYYTVDVHVSRAFRYVRYVGPSGSYARIAEMTFYGYPSDDSPETQYYRPTNLPLMVIHTTSGNDPASKVTNVDCVSQLVYESKKGNQKLLGDSIACTIRGRGNASWNEFDKKPYRIKFAKKVDMPLGGGKFKKWTLLSNYGDKTLMRNMLAFDMSRRMEMAYTPYSQPVDLMLNGEYKGTYLLCDQIEVGEGRLDIDELKKDDTSNDVLTGGYFYEYDGNASASYFTPDTWASATEQERAYSDMGFYTNRYEDVFRSDNRWGNPITIKSPDEDEINMSQFQYLKTWLNGAENEIYHQRAGMNDYVDFESFARFFITSEFAGNTDTFYELYQYKKRGDQKLYFGPCWDYDLGYSNDYRIQGQINNANQTEWVSRYDASYIETWSPNNAPSRGHTKLYAQRLLDNANTTQALRENWAYVRTGDRVSNDTLQALVREYIDLLDESQQLNFMRWPILGRDVHMNYDSWKVPTYLGEVGRVQQYIRTRMNFFDRKLELGSNKSYSFSIGEDEWSTIYLPFAFMAPDGVEVYTVAGVGEEEASLSLQPVAVGRPNHAYLVHAAPGRYRLEGYGAPACDLRQNGLLTGTSNTLNAPSGSYVLQRVGGRMGFYRVDDTAVDPKVNSNRAYLSLSANAAAAGPCFYLEEECGIGEVLADAEGSFLVYDLSGQLVYSHPEPLSDAHLTTLLPKGHYIVVSGSKKRKILL